MQPSYLVISKVTLDFPTAKGVFRAIDAVDLTINKGEFVSLIGHSGCGKSTVLNVIAACNRPAAAVSFSTAAR